MDDTQWHERRGGAEKPDAGVSVSSSLAALAIASTVAAAKLAGCSPHSVTTEPEPPIEPPSAYETERAGEPPEAWWLDLQDAELEVLIDRTFAGNLRLASAWARLEQARATARQVGAATWPQVSAEVRASRQEVRNLLADTDDVPDDLPFEIDDTVRQDTISADVAASYELDLWRRLDSEQRAAALDAEAARDDAEILAISLAAEVAETWYDLVAERAQAELFDDQIEINETFLELAELRFERGLAPAGDVHQQREQLQSTRARRELAEARAEVARYQLAVLVGDVPGATAFAEQDELPALPAPPATGLPADLLERRPDVRAAQRRVEAADHRIAAAIADRLPSLQITGSAGFQSDSIRDLLTTPIWSLAASLGQILFDGGRLRAEVDRAEAVRTEVTAEYGLALLEALAEVEGALAQERQQRAYIAERERELDSAEAALRDITFRYRRGLIEFLPVLTALQSVQALELELITARRQALSFRIQLYRALGGTWPQDLEPGREAEEPA